MSRSEYTEECDDNWGLIRYRGAVASRGKRGQAFLREMLEAMDAMIQKKLTAHYLEKDGLVCAMGSVGLARQLDMKSLDPEDPSQLASAFGVNEKLVREITYVNDEYGWETPEDRYEGVLAWVVEQLAQ